ncbi:MAG: hypothetical protein ACK4SN_11855 [Bellilinea sp.]
MTRPFLAGLIGGLLGGVIGVVAGALFTRLILLILPRRSGGWEDLIYGILAVILSYPLGAGIGGGLALRRFSRRGMVWKAILAAYAGEIILMLLADPLGINLSTNLMFGLIVTVPLAAILTAFWFNRRREEASL